MCRSLIQESAADRKEKIMTSEYDSIYNASAAPPTAESTIPTKPTEPFEKKEQILAFSAMAAGFLFIRFCCYHVTGLLTTLLFCLIITMCIIYLKRSGKTFEKHHKVLAGVLYAFSTVYTVTANHFLTFLNTVFLICVICLFVYAVCQPDSKTFRWLPYSMEKAILSHPFGSFGKCPAAAFSAARKKSGWKHILHVVLGLLLTIPLTSIVAMLLCNADEGMAKLMNKLIFAPDFESLILIPHLAFGALIGFYLFGLLYSNAATPKPLSDAECEKSILGMRIMPNAMVYAAVTPICILYVLFFVSQFRYFLGGFTGELAEGFTYAEYARKGFFELCTVCCINFAVIGIMSFMAKLCGELKPVMLKIYTLFLSVCSLVLAGTAMAKMFLYINAYGMTQMRIYTTWFMVLLIIGFVLIIIRQFRKHLPVCRIGFILFTAMFGLLCFSRPDAWITRYNAEMYIAGKLAELDIEMINSELSDDAVAVLSSYQNGELAAYNSTTNTTTGYTIDILIQESLNDYHNDFYQSLNLSAWIIQMNGVTAK